MANKILIVTKTFYPIVSPRSFRATELAKEFARQGHRVTVITPRTPGVHDEFEIQHGCTIKDLGRPKWQPVGLKGKGLPLLFRRVFRRMAHLLFEYPDIQLVPMVKKALAREAGYDLLISIAVPHPIHWGVAAVWSARHPIARVWVADCGDPYVGRENDSFQVPFYFKYVENWFMKKADYVSVPIEEARSRYVQKFHKKIVVIPQGFTFPGIRKKAVDNEPVTFIYAGSIFPYQHYAIPFFNFLKTIEQDFRFIVFTRNPLYYKQHLKEVLHKIEINDYVERFTLIKQLSIADFLVYFPYKNPSQRPLKLIDYAYSARPVLAYSGEETNNRLKEFMNKDYKNKVPMNDIEQYKINNVCRRFLQLI